MDRWWRRRPRRTYSTVDHGHRQAHPLAATPKGVQQSVRWSAPQWLRHNTGYTRSAVSVADTGSASTCWTTPTGFSSPFGGLEPLPAQSGYGRERTVSVFRSSHQRPILTPDKPSRGPTSEPAYSPTDTHRRWDV
jgi:hypothetical protein